MERSQKAEFIEEMRGAFAAAPFVILTDYKGTTVADLNRVRRQVQATGASFSVVKNTLCRKALADSDKASLAEHFRGNIGVVFSGEDAIGAAKAFRALKKEIPTLAPKAGFFDGMLLDEAGVESVANLLSREELLVQCLATIQAPARNILYLLNNFASKLEESGS